MNLKNKRNILSAVCLAAGIILTSCGLPENYDSSRFENNEETVIFPVSAVYLDETYEGSRPVTEETEAVFISADGLCRIEKKKSYYDITIDYEKGSHYAAGAAYAEALQYAVPEFTEKLEPYLYENIYFLGFNETSDLSVLTERTDALMKSLDMDYCDEIKGFAEKISGGTAGYSEDGIITFEEAVLIQFIPDVLRTESCSALSVSGSRTKSGKPITSRTVEWIQGSENQLGDINCVIHMKNGSKSLTSISYLSMLNIMTGVNNDGVMAGILDNYYANVDFEGRLSYTWELRKALENFSTAAETAEYINRISPEFTFNHNMIISDSETSWCAENAVDNQDEKSALRTWDSDLNDILDWDSKDSLCIVNTFCSDGNFGISNYNLIKWQRYNYLANERFLINPEGSTPAERYRKMDVSDIMYIVTAEDVENYPDSSYVYGDDVSQIIITDYSDHSIRAVFTGSEGTKNHPDFFYLGTFD